MEQPRTATDASEAPAPPAIWAHLRRDGKTAFLLKVGIPAAGIPLAILLNVMALWLRGDSDLLLSPRNAVEIAYTLLLVAPLAGVLVGSAVWGRMERVGRDTDDWIPDDVRDASRSALEVDDEQRRLTALAARLDELARRAPHRLAWRVIGFIALGYAYVFTIVAILVLSVVWLARSQGEFAGIARPAAQFLGWFGVFILTALWVRLLEPAGRRITRAGSPALFAALDDIQRTLDAPAPDVVLVDGQLNAAVSEIPRYGIFGLPRRYLVVGLPLLEALPADECRAILAHEMAHLSRRHGRRLVWTARLSVTWDTLAASLEGGRHWGRMLFLPFFRWYAPRFAIHAQAVARRDEHEADALSAECVGAPAAARAMLRLHLSDRFLSESILPPILGESVNRAEPPSGVFERIGESLRAGPNRGDIERWSQSVLAERTLDQHTHPSLADRIALLGIRPDAGGADVSAMVDQLRATGGTSGADELLGRHRLAKLRKQIEGDWQEAMLDHWRGLHADALIWRARSDDGDDQGSFESLWARARWATECEPHSVALPLVREVLERSSSHLEAKLCLGRLLMQSEEAAWRDEGRIVLEQVAGRDSKLALVGCALLESEYARLGASVEVERVQTRARMLQAEVLEGLRERRELRSSDRLTPYPLPAPMLAAVQKACALRDDVDRAYVLRKRTDHLRDEPCVILAVELIIPWYKPATGEDVAATCQALLGRVTLPENADLLVHPVATRSRLRRRLRSMQGVEVYRRA